MMTGPKPVQKPHPPVIVGGAFPQAARRAIRYGQGWIPIAGRGDITDLIPEFRRMAAEAGRDPADLPISMFSAKDDPDMLKRFRDLGVARVTVALPSAPAADVLPVLDRWAELNRLVNG